MNWRCCLKGRLFFRKTNVKGGILQQRYRNKLVWMKLLGLPDFKREDLVLFREHVQQLVQQKAQSSVLIKVFSGSKICKSFTLVCGDSSDEVERSANIVNDMMMAYQRDDSDSKAMPNNTTALPQPQSQSTACGAVSAVEQEGKQLSWEPPPPDMEERQSALQQGDFCKLTVPSWVTKSSTRSLFRKSILLYVVFRYSSHQYF